MNLLNTNIAFNPEIPPPVALCCWKHHLNFVIANIDNLALMPDKIDIAVDILDSIGGTLLDMYTGDLSPTRIAEEIVDHPQMCHQLCSDTFSDWISLHGKEYRCLTIGDGSRWALRVGHYPERYIHIHPGRNSPNTFRFRSANLKVAIAYRILFGWTETNYSNSMLNRAREFAKLPPLGGKIRSDGTIKILNYLRVKNH